MITLLINDFGSRRLTVDKNHAKSHNRDKEFILRGNIEIDLSKEELLELAEELKMAVYRL